MQYENERMEFKSQLTDDIYKEVIAFTNTDGGVIYIGIDDQGNVTGIDNVDETYTRLTNGIRDAIQPDVTMFVRYVLQENKVIRIEVGEGSYKPYYLKSKGLKPAGVYVRPGRDECAGVAGTDPADDQRFGRRRVRRNAHRAAESDL